MAIREAGKDAILINNNPETVSTDFDTSDRLYFEPLTLNMSLKFCYESRLTPFCYNLVGKLQSICPNRWTKDCQN